jgi:hypothetical protein
MEKPKETHKERTAKPLSEIQLDQFLRELDYSEG